MEPWIVHNPSPGSGLSDDQSAGIENDFFSIAFDLDKGRFDLHRHDGSLLLSKATVHADTSEGKASIAAGSYEHTADSRSIHDRIGKGRQLSIQSRDLKGKLDFESRFSLYENSNCMVIEAACRNVTRHGLVLKSIGPVCSIAEEGSSLRWPGASKVLTNGAMYYDAGMVHDFGASFIEPEPYGITKGGALAPDIRLPAGDRVRSWWNVGFFRGYKKEGLVCGFIENHTGLGQIIVSRKGSGRFQLYTESVLAPATVLEPGQSISSNRFMIGIASDPYTALETYAGVMGTLNRARCHSIVNGWCGWFFTYEFVTEEEVVRNAEYAARYLKPYGLDYVQIDEGYQRYHGDWEGNDRFPHGMKWLAGRIRSLGLKPGIWLAPYVVSEPTEVCQKHPEWLLKRLDGRPMRVGPWPSEESDWARNENPKRYGLDITHPDAARWLHDLFRMAAQDWGYALFKIDFVAWSLLSAHRYHDPGATPAQAYRKGLEIIRSAIGPRRHVNDCGPGPVSVGLIDSMRIECDQNYGFAKAAWKQYFLDSSSSAAAAAKRYYFHKRTWVNDADHVCIGMLSIPQAQAAASLIALSGGNIVSGDRLPDLDMTRLEILRKVFPAFGEAARPVDLFDSDRPSVFALTIKKPYGEWTIVGLFNPSETDTINKSFSLERLWLNPRKRYVAFDFWMERFWGEVSNRLQANVLPASVTLLALHEKTSHPQVISTDRHVLQGAIELKAVAWDAATRTLSGTSNGPIGTAHNVFVYLPEEQIWAQGEKALHHDFEGYTLKVVDRHILRVHVKFDRSEHVRWQIQYDNPKAKG